MKRNQPIVKDFNEAKEEVEDLKETSITIDTLLGTVAVAVVVWTTWFTTYFIFMSR